MSVPASRQDEHNQPIPLVLERRHQVQRNKETPGLELLFIKVVAYELTVKATPVFRHKFKQLEENLDASFQQVCTELALLREFPEEDCQHLDGFAVLLVDASVPKQQQQRHHKRLVVGQFVIEKQLADYLNCQIPQPQVICEHELVELVPKDISVEILGLYLLASQQVMSHYHVTAYLHFSAQLETVVAAEQFSTELMEFGLALGRVPEDGEPLKMPEEGPLGGLHISGEKKEIGMMSFPEMKVDGSEYKHIEFDKPPFLGFGLLEFGLNLFADLPLALFEHFFVEGYLGVEAELLVSDDFESRALGQLDQKLNVLFILAVIGQQLDNQIDKMQRLKDNLLLAIDNLLLQQVLVNLIDYVVALLLQHTLLFYWLQLAQAAHQPLSYSLSSCLLQVYRPFRKQQGLIQSEKVRLLLNQGSNFEPCHKIFLDRMISNKFFGINKIIKYLVDKECGVGDLVLVFPFADLKTQSLDNLLHLLKVPYQNYLGEDHVEQLFQVRVDQHLSKIQLLQKKLQGLLQITFQTLIDVGYHLAFHVGLAAHHCLIQDLNSQVALQLVACLSQLLYTDYPYLLVSVSQSLENNGVS